MKWFINKFVDWVYHTDKIPETRIKVTAIGDKNFYEAQYHIKKRLFILMYILRETKSRWIVAPASLLKYQYEHRRDSKERAEAILKAYLQKSQEEVTKRLNLKNKKVTYYTLGD